MAIESLGAAGYVRSLLAADTALVALVGDRLFADFALNVDPATGEKPAYPFVIFSLNTATDKLATAGDRVYCDFLWLVKAVGKETGYAAIAAAANRIDAALQNAAAAVITSGGVNYTVMGAYRERAIHYSEPASGVAYYHLGGLYRVLVDPA